MIVWPIEILQNKYTKWYERIVLRAQTRTLPENSYFEKHHIIPRSLGGNNSKENLAILTAREHFICHWLLTKMLSPGIERSKMFRALNFMRAKSSEQYRYSSLITSRVYEKIKPFVVEHQTQIMTGRVPTESHRKKMSAAMKGRKHTEEHRRNSSLARKGKPGHKWSEEQRANYLKRIEEQGGGMLGKNHSAESRKKISESHKARVITDEERAARSARVRGENNPMYGRKQTEEAKAKMSRLGMKHTEEAKAKMSVARRGMIRGPLSEETKKKISESRLAKIATGEIIPWNRKDKNE
jgi:hypothetical protein